MTGFHGGRLAKGEWEGGRKKKGRRKKWEKHTYAQAITPPFNLKGLLTKLNLLSDGCSANKLERGNLRQLLSDIIDKLLC